MSQSIQVNGQTINYPEIGDLNWGVNATNFAIETSAALGKLGLSSGTSVHITQTLDVTGNTTVGGVIYADDDTTANTPVLSFTGDTNTGIGRSAADTLDFITNGNSRFRIESTGQIKAVYESQVGTDYNTTLHNGYLCRAWVNFNGTGTVSIRASGNVSSITDNGTGYYNVNFTTAMPDANYAAIGSTVLTQTANQTGIFVYSVSVSTFAIINYSTSGTAYDENLITATVFR